MPARERSEQEVSGVRILMVGGTGPSGIPIVRALVEHGHDVTILHRGTHERPETPAAVAHIHAHPFDQDSFTDALAAATWDTIVAMYGRLRMVAQATKHRSPDFVSPGRVTTYH